MQERVHGVGDQHAEVWLEQRLLLRGDGELRAEALEEREDDGRLAAGDVELTEVVDDELNENDRRVVEALLVPDQQAEELDEDRVLLCLRI